MFLVDRIVLARYSIDSMMAAMLGGSMASLYTLTLMSIAGTTEVFIGQYNGAKKYYKIGSVVWQMIYFVVISLIFTIPVGYFTEFLNLIPQCYAEEGVPYQRMLTYFCWLPALTAAFSGFFVGRGQTKIITLVVIIGTLANLILDYLLVFGYGDVIPRLGCRGAAIATISAEGIQALILACGFWSERNRERFNTVTGNKFNGKIFLGCLRIGFPMALGKCVEMMAWYLVLSALSHVSKELATIQGIVTTVYVLFAFVCDGLIKGSATLSANFIGQKNMASIVRVFKKLTIITIAICSVAMLPLLIAPNLLFCLLDRLHEDISALYPAMTTIFKVMFVGVTTEALCCIPCGILLSGGDVKYPITANLLCIWGIVVVPVAMLFVTKNLNSAVLVNVLSVINDMVCFAIILHRYKSLKWYKSLIN
jgi:MATE family multidrug resistance protein